MKTFYSCFTLILMVVLSRQVSAQSMNTVNSILNDQAIQSNLQANQQMQSNLLMNTLLFDNSDNLNFQYNYLVTMKDNSQFVVHSKIYSDTVKHKTYLVFVDKKYSRRDSGRNRKIYVSQTLSIARRTGSDGSEKKWYKGMATDSCWMFKAIAGNINAYSTFSEDGLGLIPPPLMAIQKGEGPIIKLTANNLKTMVEQDAGALKNIQKKNYYKAIEKYNHDAEKATKK